MTWKLGSATLLQMTNTQHTANKPQATSNGGRKEEKGREEEGSSSLSLLYFFFSLPAFRFFFVRSFSSSFFPFLRLSGQAHTDTAIGAEFA